MIIQSCHAGAMDVRSTDSTTGHRNMLRERTARFSSLIRTSRVFCMLLRQATDERRQKTRMLPRGLRGWHPSFIRAARPPNHPASEQSRNFCISGSASMDTGQRRSTFNRHPTSAAAVRRRVYGV